MSNAVSRRKCGFSRCPIKRALISVSDKENIVEFARGLSQIGIQLISTGKTVDILVKAGLEVTEVSTYTGFPELLDGRLKTLHPKIHGGILAKRNSARHTDQLTQYAIEPIDLVCVNLYPFAATIKRADCSVEEAIENIDIGGPAMIRAAAKNWTDVAVVTDKLDYDVVLDELRQSEGSLSDTTRFKLAQKAFSHTAIYDGAIANYFNSLTLGSLQKEAERQVFPDQLNLSFRKLQNLRYGENPHQSAAFYRDYHSIPQGSLVEAKQLQGKPLSYNNIADADAAWNTVNNLASTACVIVKHANPCGAAMATTTLDAYHKAYLTDTTSAFGGIIAFNRCVEEATAAAVAETFVEVLLAPSFTEEAKNLLAAKKNLRVLEVPLKTGSNTFELKRIEGGILVQTADEHAISTTDLKIVTKRAPTATEIKDLLFAWRIVKFVKSNAIVFAKNEQTLGIGAGQMSRIDSTHLAQSKALQANLSLTGAVAASDAFFPFRDGVEAIAQQGIVAIIQAGGSIRDNEIIAAADEWGLAMVLTGFRHFRH